MVVGQRALAHQRVRDRDRQVVDELAQLVGGVGEQHAAAGVDHRRLRARASVRTIFSAVALVDRRLVQRRCV